ncbi:MAG: hypothetical protein ABSE86_37945 [Bryobacteraceae bacterium]|jgi:hypothetical protein
MSTQNNEKTPDQMPLTKMQVERLSSLTGVAATKLNGLSVSEIGQQFRWQIDPNLLLFRRICGKVVKKDPNTGIEYGVPFATVYAEDTICNILGLFPIDVPWSWFFPFLCHTEVIGQTTTDACGNFCVWVPRFEIEWILRWRIERICYLESFQKPTVGSVLKYLQGQPVGPGPDPGPEATVTLKPGTALYEKAKAVLGAEVVSQLAQLGSTKTFGAQTTGQQALLSRQAFSTSVAPALPREFQKRVAGDASEHRTAVQSTLANKLGLNASVLKDVDLTRFYGPFIRCFDIIVTEWVPIFEVPDITFRVTQNINGVEQTIYSTGLFDVSWDANGDSNVTLVASPIAVSSTVCNTPTVPCGNVPSLEYVGLMPLVNPPLPAAPYIDATAGFATRPNAPHPGGTIGEAGVPPATAPYTDTLQIYGCVNVDKAAFYRLEYTYTPPGGSPTALAPFVLTWPLYLEVGGVLKTMVQSPDPQGWYSVTPINDGWFPNPMVLEWNTADGTWADGLYTVQLEVANSSKTLLATSTPVGFMIDNSAPIVVFSAEWSFASDLSGAQSLPTTDCVVIDRGATPVDVYVQLTFSVNASHLRETSVSSGGCSGGALPLSPLSVTQHWYENAADNSFSGVALYRIPASYPAGVYSFGLYADTRAFNPSGGDGGQLLDWNYNPGTGVYNYVDPQFSVAVVNV